MTDWKLNIEQIKANEDIPFDLLVLADPFRIQINEYINTGTCYAAKIGARVVGVLVLNQIDSTRIEVKNIAVKATEQGKGIGKALLRHSVLISQKLGFDKLVLGTGNSSIGQLALYQKVGFEMCRIEKDFFIRNYPESIFENGIQCKHMVILEKDLKKIKTPNN